MSEATLIGCCVKQAARTRPARELETAILPEPMSQLGPMRAVTSGLAAFLAVVLTADGTGV